MSLKIESPDPDFAKIIEEVGKVLCLALDYTGPLTLSYRVSDSCIIKVVLSKEKPVPGLQ